MQFSLEFVGVIHFQEIVSDSFSPILFVLQLACHGYIYFFNAIFIWIYWMLQRCCFQVFWLIFPLCQILFVLQFLCHWLHLALVFFSIFRLQWFKLLHGPVTWHSARHPAWPCKNYAWPGCPSMPKGRMCKNVLKDWAATKIYIHIYILPWITRIAHQSQARMLTFHLYSNPVWLHLCLTVNREHRTRMQCATCIHHAHFLHVPFFQIISMYTQFVL